MTRKQQNLQRRVETDASVRDVGDLLGDKVRKRAEHHREFKARIEKDRPVQEALVHLNPAGARRKPSILAEEYRREANQLTPYVQYIMDRLAHHDETPSRKGYGVLVWWDTYTHLEAHARQVAERLTQAPAGDVEALRQAQRDLDEALMHYPFLQRNRIADPLFTGQPDIITLDLAGLVETGVQTWGELRDALSSGGANPKEEKVRQLPAVVYEKAYRTKGGETFEGFVRRVEYALRARGFADTPRRKITVRKEDDNGNPVKRRIFVPREVPLSDDNDEGGDEDARPRMVHHAKHSPTPVDTTSSRVIHDLVLRDVFERANPTARQYEITLRKEIDKEPTKQIADEYGVSPSTVYNTVAQTQRKFRAALEEVERPKK